MRNFWIALAATAVPITAFEVMALVLSGSRDTGVLGAIVFGLYAGGIIAAIVLAIVRRRRVSAGIFAGLGIGLVSLVVTCFAVVFTAF